MQLKIKNLSKTYPNGVHALNNINLEIPAGMYGLLGPNGAGKSSLMRTIACLQKPDSGSIFLDELDLLNNPVSLRKMLGYLPQDYGLDPGVSAKDMLTHLAILKGIGDAKQRKQRVDELLHHVNLHEARNKKLGTFSGGMKQRFGIAQCLLANPRLIIVDEPTAGLDPAERVRFLNLLSELGENIIVILSTHIVADVKELCANMAIIRHGELLLEGKPHELVADLEGKVWQKLIEKKELKDYEERYDVILSRLQTGKVLIHILSDNNPLDAFESVQPDLEDVYFTTMRKKEQELV